MDRMMISECINSIKYAQLFYEYGRLNDFIDATSPEAHEDMFAEYYEVLDICADAFFLEYLDAYEQDKWYFSNCCMGEYYRLCEAYGKQQKIKAKHNPYIKNTHYFVATALDLEGNGGYAWNLTTATNHEWGSGIVFFHDDYFNSEFELVEALLDIRVWYEQAVVRLRKELLEEQVIPFPVQSTQVEVMAA